MAELPTKPFSDSRLIKFLQKRILELKPRKSQLQIATEAGFPRATMLAMLKSGAAKLPLDRVPGLAKALECDPRLLFTMALEQQDSSTTQAAIEQIFGSVVTLNELAWLDEIRRASSHSNPSLTSRARSSIRAIFGK